MKDIAAQWQRFAPYLGKVPGQVGSVAYGLCLNTAGSNGFDYVSGVEVLRSSGLPSELSAVSIPAQTYAVFLHRVHLSKLSETLDTIWNKWLPESGHQVARGGVGTPEFFERYADSFDPQTGMGGVEVWIPVKS
jgi:AraC family transcriptional regulator